MSKILVTGANGQLGSEFMPFILFIPNTILRLLIETLLI